MDTQEAKQILQEKRRQLSERSYEYFASVAGIDRTESVLGPSGVEYRVTTQATLYREKGDSDVIEVDVVVIEAKNRSWLAAQFMSVVSATFSVRPDSEEDGRDA